VAVATSGGSESLSAADGCDWSTEVGDVRRCQSMLRLVRQQTQLELDAMRDGEASGGGLATRNLCFVFSRISVNMIIIIIHMKVTIKLTCK